MFFRNKKGQAALEFLMTYGWAILVVLIVIGALAFFLSSNDPTDLIPEGCNNFVNAGVVCTDYQIATDSANSSAQFVLQARARDIEISGFEITIQGQTTDLCSAAVGVDNSNPADGDVADASDIDFVSGNNTNSSAPNATLTLLNGNAVTILCPNGNATAFGTEGETINLALSLTWKELNDEFVKTAASSAVATITKP